MSYAVRVTERAIRELGELPAQVQRRIQRRIDALAENPRPPNAKQLSDRFRGIMRLRIGSYRVSYTIDEKARTVDVLRAGHRGTFYKRLGGK